MTNVNAWTRAVLLLSALVPLTLASGPVSAQAPQEAAEAAPLEMTQPPLIAQGWRSGPSLDTARAGLNAVTFGERIFAAGGAGVVSPRNDFEVFDPTGRRWRALAPLPVGLERFGMTADAERIWAGGGYSAESGSAPITQMWSYDPDADVWQAETELPGPKASFSLVALDGKLYALGGEDGAPGVFVYDVETASWSTLDAPPETARRGAAAIVLDGEIWLIGGASDGEATGRVDIFDPETGVWRIGPALPEARAGHAAAVNGRTIHVFGGRSADLRRTLSDHLVLTAGQRNWTPGVALVVPRTEAAAAALPGEIMLIGGGAGSGFFAPFTAVASVDVLSVPRP